MLDDTPRTSSPPALKATAVFDVLEQPVSLFTDTGTYLYVNAAGAELLGMAADALLGRHYLDVFPDLREHPFHLAFQRVASLAQARERLEFWYAPLGLWSSQHIYRVGALVVVTWENITARKATESQLEAALARAADSERMFRTMIEGMPQPAWTAKADGYVDYYNPRWYDFTGTLPQQMQGWGWHSVHDPAYLPTVIERWSRSVASGERFEMEFPLRRHDGVYRWFLTRVAPVRDELGSVVRWVGISTDIDDQRRALRELDETLESMGDAFFLLDADWRLLRVNRRQEEVSRTSRADTLGRVFWEVFPETRNPDSKYWQEYHRCMQERAPVHFIEYYAPLDVWTEVDAFPSRHGGIAVFFRDVSVRRRYEQALSRERAVLEAIFREAPIGLALFDDQFRFLRLNSVLAEINGLPVAEHIGRPVLDVLPGLPGEMLDKWREVLRTGTAIVDVEVVGTTPRAPDTVRTWRASYFPVRVDNQTIGLGNVVKEITEERRLAEERQQALTSLELLAETSTVLSSSLDYEANLARVTRLLVPRIADMCSIYVVAASGAVEQVAASHSEDEDAEGWRLIEGERGLQRELTFYAKVELSGETELVCNVGDAHYAAMARSSAELELIRKLAPTSWIIVPLKAQQGTLGAIAVAAKQGRTYSETDVPLVEEIGKRASLAIENARLYQRTASALDGERRARDKAEHATRLKDEFLATLSHELRTPLTAVLGWARMLQSGALAEEKRSKAHDAIVRNAVAQNQLIEDMLDVSRIITGKLRLNVDFIDVNGIVEAALEGISPAAQAKGVRLQSLLDSDAGLISGDAGRIQQVVWNLLSNAVKFTPRGGRVHVTLRQAHSSVEVSVADTGVGIAPDFLPYVFDRFRQQDGAITRKAGGLGLGLAIAKNLVELHGGTLEARSAGENQGAIFIMRIPVAPLRSAPVSQRPATSSPGAGALASVKCPPQLEGLRIMVVDDEPDARDLLRAILEHCGAIVTTEATAAGAMASLASFKPEVIVSDIGMPDEDGYSFVRRLRARPREAGGRTPAIALTAYARPEDRTRALLEGFQSHTAKPIDPEELLVVIASVAGQSA